MWLSVLALLVGFGLLVTAADRAVEQAEALSDRLGLSPVVVGALVVGVGTSLPELVVSGLAAVQRDSIDLAVGNVVGSNAANLTLVLGTAALITSVSAKRSVIGREGLLMLLAALLLSGFLLDDRLARWEGFVLVAAMVGAALFIAQGIGNGAPPVEHEAAPGEVRTTVLWVVGGLVGVVAGAQLVVLGAVDVADWLGLSEGLVGLTIVAIGTSLPELATAVASARRGSVELIIGNVFGSNVFNSLGVAGFTGLLGSGGLDQPMRLSLLVMVVVTVVALGIGMAKTSFSRWAGLLLIALYPLIVLARDSSAAGLQS